jgi:hypothetical protein
VESKVPITWEDTQEFNWKSIAESVTDDKSSQDNFVEQMRTIKSSFDQLPTITYEAILPLLEATKYFLRRDFLSKDSNNRCAVAIINLINTNTRYGRKSKPSDNLTEKIYTFFSEEPHVTPKSLVISKEIIPIIYNRIPLTDINKNRLKDLLENGHDDGNKIDFRGPVNRIADFFRRLKAANYISDKIIVIQTWIQKTFSFNGKEVKLDTVITAWKIKNAPAEGEAIETSI